MSAKDACKEQQSNILLKEDGPLIPQGPYPLMPEGRLNYFGVSFRGLVSQSSLKRKAEICEET